MGVVKSFVEDVVGCCEGCFERCCEGCYEVL